MPGAWSHNRAPAGSLVPTYVVNSEGGLVVIGPNTYDAVKGEFNLRAMGEFTLMGLGQLVLEKSPQQGVERAHRSATRGRSACSFTTACRVALLARRLSLRRGLLLAPCLRSPRTSICGSAQLIRRDLLAVAKNPLSIARYLAAAGELIDGAQPGLGHAEPLAGSRPTLLEESRASTTGAR